MPAQICPRCKRANPEMAAFCYNDGAELRAAADGSAYQMPAEFAFPSGRRCRTYDDFALGCQEEWATARDLLQRGAFAQFFGSAGRADLVRAAQDARAEANPDIALTTFLAALPGVRTQTPRLDLHPRRFLLGTLTAGETRQLGLTITNAGQGNLQGTASVTEGQEMLSLDGSRPTHEVPVTAPRQQQFALYVNTRGLAANQSHGAKLTVVTNGGVAEIPLRLDLVAQPFSAAPFQGVKAQRELAERMRKQPKAAVPLLESGTVRQWFEANGWTYPVEGTAVKGVAAVQQFFEAMGLSKPPAVQVSPPEVRLRCRYPESARVQLTLSTGVKKWVYAAVSSDSPWLQVPNPQVSGPQQTTFLIEVDSGRMAAAGPQAEGRVKVVANGGQALEVRVIADVAGLPAAKPTPAPPTGRMPAVPRPATATMRMPGLPTLPSLSGLGGAARTNILASLLVLPLVVLLFRLAMVPISDGFLRPTAVSSAARKLDVPVAPDAPVAQTGGWLLLPWFSILTAANTPIPAELFVPGSPGAVPAADFRDYFVGSYARWFVLGTWWLGAAAGVVLVARRGGVLDVPWGFIAGSVAGLAGGATLASLFLVVESVPHLIWHVATHDSGGNFFWWAAWVALSLVCWLALAVGVGIVCSILPPLRRLALHPLQRLTAVPFRALGLPALANFWFPAAA
jgi:hypothetical protein